MAPAFWAFIWGKERGKACSIPHNDFEFLQIEPKKEPLLFSVIHYLLHADWISWIFHFVIFYTLARWSGIKWQWALILVLSIEIWETADWSLKNPLYWWSRADTWLDMTTGSLGVWLGHRER